MRRGGRSGWCECRIPYVRSVLCLLNEGFEYRFGIAPWNAPIGLTIRAVAVPLICGNTVVLKCSEMTPRSQGIVVEILEKVVPFAASQGQVLTCR